MSVKREWRSLRGSKGRSEQGVHILEFALIVPVLFGMVLAIAEPLVVMHRYNGIHHQLTELTDDARGNVSLLGDFWNGGSDPDSNPEYQAFKEARANLSQRFTSAMSGVSGVSVIPVTHLDRIGTEERWVELDIGYLPPMTSAVVNQWHDGPNNSASLNNSHACGVVAQTTSSANVASAHNKFNARKKLQNHEDSEDQPRSSRSGERATCRIKEVPAAELASWSSLPSVSAKLPTEMMAVVEVKGIVGSYPMVVAVPFYPQVPQAVTAPSCLPKASSGSWSNWNPVCGPGTRTKTDSDQCSNSWTFTESRCQTCYEWRAGWGRDNPNGEWSPNCEADGMRRQWKWEQDTGGCEPNRGHHLQAGCRPTDSRCGWVRTNTSECPVACGGGERAYTDTNACNETRPGVEVCNTQPCCNAHRLDLNKEGIYGTGTGKTLVSGENTSCLSKWVDTAVNAKPGASTCFGRQCIALSFGGLYAGDYKDDSSVELLCQLLDNGVNKAFYGDFRGCLLSRFISENSSTVYLSEDCSSVIPASSVNSLCSHVQFGWKISPISLVWGGAESLTEEEIVFAQFPLFAEPEKGWVVWKASGQMPLLVRDPDGTGVITSGEQLFGSRTFGGKPGGGNWEHGFEALATLDIDKDGKVSGGELSGLSLWFDENRDAVSHPGEVKPLSDPSVGVTELFYKEVKVVKETGDVVAEIGFTRTVDSRVVKGKAIDWFSEGASSRQQLVNQLVASSRHGAEGAVAESTTLPESKKEAPVTPDSPPATGGAIRKRVSSPLNGIWIWKADGERSKELNNQDLNGVLLFADFGKGVIAGQSIVEVPFIEGAPYRGQITSISFSGKSKKRAGNKRDLSFTIFPGGERDKESAVSTTAVLDENTNTIRGTSRAQVMYEGKLRQISYSWTAKRKGAEQQQVAEASRKN